MIATTEDSLLIKKTIIEYKKQLKGRKIIIFGCTMYAKDIKTALEAIGANLFCMIDNNSSKAGPDKYCLGVPVFFPNEIDFEDNEIRIIICSKYAAEMMGQLEQLGVNREKIFQIKILEDACLYNDSIDSFELAKKEVISGFEIFQRLNLKGNAYQVVFIFPYPGTGDIYLACSLLRKYLKENAIEKFAFVLSSKSCIKVAELFADCDFYELRAEELSLLLKYWEFAGAESSIKPLLYWGWRTKRYLYADNYPQINFSNMFIYDVFGYDRIEKFEKPRQIEMKKTKHFFSINKLIENRTVVLAPYASSFISELTAEFWESLAEKLNKLGYIVCTNSCGSNEPPIRGTRPIFFEYNQAINFMNLAGFFIGIRSGLCDVISSSKCRKIILYENSFNASRLSFFGLGKMNLCSENILELDYGKWTVDADGVADGIRLIIDFIEGLENGR